MAKKIDLDRLKEYQTLTNGGIATIETSSSASKAYAIGDYFWFKGKLCKATAAIASGGTITLNTNCVLGQLADDLTSQSEKINVEIQNDLIWLLATISNKGYPTYQVKRLLTGQQIPLCDVSVGDGADIAIHAYDSTMQYLGGWTGWVKSVKKSEILARYSTAKYMRVIFMRTANTNCSYTDIQTYGVKIIGNYANTAIEKNNSDNGITVVTPLEVGGIKADGITVDPPSTTSFSRLRTGGFVALEKGCVYKGTVPKGIKFSVSFYPNYSLQTTRTNYTPWYLNSGIFIATDDYARFTFAKNDTTQNLTIADVNSIELEKVVSSDGYLIDSGFNKVIATTFPIGTLSGVQSFCKYNNKYYSANGTNLYVQAEDFTVESTTALSLGHCNSFQLGHNGKAYASGWDDDTVYVVDLANKTITDTITLPVSGYTTVAVDDINKLMYIFHRTSTPTTEDYYDFVVYDYDNDQVISTKKITKAFAFMQSCDFVDGRIFAINGGGTSETPNGYRVFNTNGDVISEYFFGSYSTTEPEGVYFDRDTHELFISYYSSSSSATLCRVLT